MGQRKFTVMATRGLRDEWVWARDGVAFQAGAVRAEPKRHSISREFWGRQMPRARRLHAVGKSHAGLWARATPQELGNQ